MSRPTPETDAAWSCFKGHTELLQDVKDLSRKLERERDEARKQAAMWKANHDNQVSLKAMLMDRPDLGDRASRIAELIRERDELAALLAAEKATRNSIIEKGVKTERERDTARAKYVAAIDGRDMANEEADKLREQNAKLLDIAERVVAGLESKYKLHSGEDIQLRIRAELDQLKEDAK